MAVMRLSIFLLCLALSCADLTPDRGYLLTLPSTLQAGTWETACLTVHNLDSAGRKLHLEFREQNTPLVPGDPPPEAEFLLFTADFQVPESVGPSDYVCFKIAVPQNLTGSEARALLKVKDASGVAFKDEKTVTIKPATLVEVVSTDRARYRPGDQVHFRFVSLQYDLRPAADLVPEVWVNNPQGIRVAQWGNVKTNHGLVQLHLKLASETVLGTWTIHMKTTDQLLKKTFVVEEYVPASFVYEIHVPKLISESQQTLTVNVCAKHLYGEPLVGAHVTSNVTSDAWSSLIERNNLKSFTSEFSLTNETGCVAQDLVIRDVGFGHEKTFFLIDVLTLNVTVSDPFSGETSSREVTITKGISSDSVALHDVSSFVKPSLPILARYTFTRGDGSAAANETAEVCIRSHLVKPSATTNYMGLISSELSAKLPPAVAEELAQLPLEWEIDHTGGDTARECREFITDERGAIDVRMPAAAEIVRTVSLTATLNRASDSKMFLVARSPAHTFLAINHLALPAKLPCTGTLGVPLLIATPGEVAGFSRPIEYQVMARGKIMDSGLASGQTVALRMRPEMSPELKLVVFVILDGGEVVSDSKILKVERCFDNQVEVAWEHQSAAPGDEVSLTVSAAPDSVCGVSIVDKNTELDGTEHQVEKDAIFAALQKFVIPRGTAPFPGLDTAGEFCRGQQQILFDILFKNGAQLGDVSRLKSGFAVHTTPAETFFDTIHSDSQHVFDEAGYLVFSNLRLKNRLCLKRERSIGRFGRSVPSSGLPGELASRLFLRSDLGSALHSSPVPAQSRQVRDQWPQTHHYGVHTVSPEGVAVIRQRLPGSTTGWMASAVCVHPEHGLGISDKAELPAIKKFFVRLTVPYSVKRGEVMNVSATVFNLYASSLSVHLELARSEQYSLSDAQTPSGVDLCIEAGRAEGAHFPLTPLTLGEVDVTVTARTKDGNCQQSNAVRPPSDTVTRSVLIKPEGFAHSEDTSHFVCLDEGQSHTLAVPLPRPRGLVEGSERAYAVVFGDRLAPDIQGLDRLANAPSGGAEPNVKALAPNVYLYSYLSSSGLLTERLRLQTVNNAQSGYQRQLRYRRQDGSYSSYGEEDPEPSLWLTAFVVKTFKEASEIITIDQQATQESAEWLLRQQLPDGCFPEIGDVLHREMQGGLVRGGKAARTAYVALALRDVVTLDRLRPALSCLENHVHLPGTTLFTEILVAHTYIKYGLLAKGKKMVDALIVKATHEGEDILYWRGDRGTIFGGRDAEDMEMTSYMVLSLLDLSGHRYLELAHKAVAWIDRERHRHGGFESTQDVVVALEALAEFSTRTFTSRAESRVEVMTEDHMFIVTVNASNRLLEHRIKVPDLELPSQVLARVHGGCVTVQTSLRYSSLLRIPNPAFSLTLTSEALPGRIAGGSYRLTVCAAYIRDSGGSERAVLELEMPSGFTAVASTLRTLRQNKVVRDFKLDGDSVTFTLERVRAPPTCLRLRIVKEADVEHRQPYIVKINDFYELERRGRLEYVL